MYDKVPTCCILPFTNPKLRPKGSRYLQTMAKPSLVLVGGAWHHPDHYADLIMYLGKHGYKCVPVTLPSMYPKNGKYPKDLQPDIEAIRNVTLRELDSGNDVVVTLHSYGGFPGNSALNGLDTKARAAAGHKTSVKSIAAFAAFLVPAGVTLKQACGGSHPIHDIRGELVHVSTPPGPGYWFYNDVPEKDQAKWINMLVPQAWAVCCSPGPHNAWEDIPTSYLICNKDNALAPEGQRAMIDGIRASGLTIKAEQCDASHSPFLSQVDMLGDFIRRGAGEDLPSELEPY